MALESGTRLGPYEVLAQIGAGGMGEVYKASDTRLNRTIAIKVKPTSISDDPDTLDVWFDSWTIWHNLSSFQDTSRALAARAQPCNKARDVQQRCENNDAEDGGDPTRRPVEPPRG